MSRLAQIETFVMVADTGSLTDVARKIHISPAAISKQMTKLETELGVQLLVRSTRKVDLTEMGLAYLEQCRRILEEVDAATALVSQMKVVPYGALKILSPPHFTMKYVTPNLPEFLSLYPDIEIHLEIGERMPHLVTENGDVIIGASASAAEGAIQRRIATTQYDICASPDYLNTFGIPKNPEELTRHRCIAHSGRRPMNRFYFHKQPDVEFKPYMSVNDVGNLAHLSILGVGIVQLHHYAVRDAISEGRLISILDEYTKRDVPIYIALPPRRFTPSKVRCFIDFIVISLVVSK